MTLKFTWGFNIHIWFPLLFTDNIFSEKGVTDLGGNPPPPFTDKIRKVVFDGLPYCTINNLSI